VTKVYEVFDKVILPFLQQVTGLARPNTNASRDNIVHNVNMQRDVNRNTHSQSIKAGAI